MKGQQRDTDFTRIRGFVVDASTGQALPFVNLTFEGTTVGTTTDLNGRFLLETKDQNIVEIIALQIIEITSLWRKPFNLLSTSSFLIIMVRVCLRNACLPSLKHLMCRDILVKLQ